MAKISIVANFYKSGKYIPKLFRSVVNQTYTDWEFICVNDCSPENDAEIILHQIKRYGVEDKVRLINNPTNLGIYGAKKVGIATAQTDYITFIDGDDWFEPDALEKLIAPMLKYDVDMVVANSRKIIPSIGYKWNIRSAIESSDYNRCIPKEELFDKFFINFFGVNIYNHAYWAKLYKTAFLKDLDIKLPCGDTCEDQVFNLAVIQKISSVYFIENIVYNWRWGGITSGKANDLYGNSLKYIYSNCAYYMYRKPLIEKYQYKKAVYYLAVEARNVLEVAIGECAEYESDDIKAQTLKDEIAKVLQHQAYQDVKQLALHDKEKYSHPLFLKIAEGDVDGIYQICHNRYKATNKRRIFKRLLHRILYI
jgi:glycosyltransferase involved in cell wall biosynthesis